MIISLRFDTDELVRCANAEYSEALSGDDMMDALEELSDYELYSD